VNQPSNPSVCCQETNSSFVVAFLNPCFSPLYLKVYSDTKLIFIVKESLINWNKIRLKNTFYFYDSAQNRTPILPDRAPIFYEWKCQFCSKNSYSDFDSFRKLQFLQFWVTFTTAFNNQRKRSLTLSRSLETEEALFWNIMLFLSFQIVHVQAHRINVKSDHFDFEKHYLHKSYR